MEHHEQQKNLICFCHSENLNNLQNHGGENIFYYIRHSLIPFYIYIDVFISILKLEMLIMNPFKRSKR